MACGFLFGFFGLQFTTVRPHARGLFLHGGIAGSRVQQGAQPGSGSHVCFSTVHEKPHCLPCGRTGQCCLLNWMGGSRCYGTRPTCCFRSSRPKNKREKSTSSTPLVLFALPRLDPTPATSVFHHCATTATATPTPSLSPLH